MIERLLENWLDSASERSYQGPFLQMLVAAGYSLLHNTRHTPIEFGKDIIAHDPEGALVAFQLKGNPGATMNLTGLRAIYPQLQELSGFVVRYPGMEPSVPKPYFVLNGELGEDAQRALDDWNVGALRTNPVAVWSRGRLLEMAKSLSVALWPSEIPDISALLKVLTVDPIASFPVDDVEAICVSMLGLSGDEMHESAAEMQRRIASAGLLVGICVHRHVEKRNHWAAIQAWSMLCGLIAACADRYELDTNGAVEATFDLALQLVDQSLRELAEEVIAAKHLAITNTFSDGAVYSARVTILSGLMGAHWHRARASKDDEGMRRAEAALKKVHVRRELWGEAAIPGELLRLWVFDHTEVGRGAEVLRIQLLDVLLVRNRDGSKNPLPPPYYAFEETMREQLFSRNRAAFKGDTHDGWCYMGIPLFEELVRQNLKQHAKAVWPLLTKLIHLKVDIPEPWEFPLRRAQSAKNLTTTLPYTGEWEKVVKAAYDKDDPPLPRMLVDRPDVVALIVLLHPQRASPAVVRYLSMRLGRSWLS